MSINCRCCPNSYECEKGKELVKYHAVMIDETGCEFGAECEAPSRSEAYDWFRENYPESRVDQLESPEDTANREKAMYDHIHRGGDWDDEGRPIFFYDYDYDEDDCEYEE